MIKPCPTQLQYPNTTSDSCIFLPTISLELGQVNSELLSSGINRSVLVDGLNSLGAQSEADGPSHVIRVEALPLQIDLLDLVDALVREGDDARLAVGRLPEEVAGALAHDEGGPRRGRGRGRAGGDVEGGAGEGGRRGDDQGQEEGGDGGPHGCSVMVVGIVHRWWRRQASDFQLFSARCLVKALAGGGGGLSGKCVSGESVIRPWNSAFRMFAH